MPVVRFEERVSGASQAEADDVDAQIADAWERARLAPKTTRLEILDAIEVLEARKVELLTVPVVREVVRIETGRTFRETWEAEDDVAVRRELLGSAVLAVEISKATRRTGPKFDTDRVEIRWAS